MNNQPYPAVEPLAHGRHPACWATIPNKAKALLKEARAVGTEVKIVCSANIAVSRESAQVIQDFWNKRRVQGHVSNPSIRCPIARPGVKGSFDGLIQGHSYRYDPDDFYGRNLHSKSAYAQILSGWQNARFDQLLDEAKQTLDPERRKTLYAPRRGTSSTRNCRITTCMKSFGPRQRRRMSIISPIVWAPCSTATTRAGGFRTAYVDA